MQIFIQLCDIFDFFQILLPHTIMFCVHFSVNEKMKFVQINFVYPNCFFYMYITIESSISFKHIIPIGHYMHIHIHFHMFIFSNSWPFKNSRYTFTHTCTHSHKQASSLAVVIIIFININVISYHNLVQKPLYT